MRSRFQGMPACDTGDTGRLVQHRKGDREVVCYAVTSVVSFVAQITGCSPPGCPVHGILQARIPERVARPTGGISQARD